MGRIYISAAHKSSGKTTVTTGLIRALTKRGKTVRPFKKGPDYIDPKWLGKASGQDAYNLDFNTQDSDEIKALLATKSAGADIAVIEGNKGLYDGVAVDGSDSNAALAKLTQSPVILVVDVSGITRGVAPLLQGYVAFDPDIRIAGVILNRVAGPRHEEKLRAAVERYTDLPVLGAIRTNPDIQLTERHLGLVPSNELGEAEALIGRMADAVAAGVDLDAILKIAGTAPALAAPSELPPAPKPDITIALARDAAFGFTYADDLEALERAGARLAFFDAMSDAALPACDGLFLPGGFPETHMAALSANTAMRDAVRTAIEGGLPTYAECGGLMYLTQSLSWNGETAAMAGVLDANAAMHDKPQGRGYVVLKPTAAHPWPGVESWGNALPAHEFHYSRLDNPPAHPKYAFEVVRGAGIDGRDGIVYKNLVAGYAHLRHTRRTPWADAFVAFVRAAKA